MESALGKQSQARQAFLCHAHADKERYVRPLARELSDRQISYWLDEAEIAWGESISKKINEGLALSEFVVIFLSDAFVGRNWPETELAAALSRENAEGRTIVLPLIIGEAARLLARYPLLKDKSYTLWTLGASAIADELEKLTSRRWSKDRLERYIIEKVDLEKFPPRKEWGPGRLLAKQLQPDGEGAVFSWNERDGTVEKYWVTSVRGLGREPLSDDDVELIRGIVAKHTR